MMELTEEKKIVLSSKEEIDHTMEEATHSTANSSLQLGGKVKLKLFQSQKIRELH